MIAIKTPVPGQTWDDFNKASGHSKITKEKWINKGLPINKVDMNKSK